MNFLVKFCIGILISTAALAQFSPLPNTAETVGLWNFDEDEIGIVIDSSINPINGTAYNTLLEAIPGIDPSFGLARKFNAPNSMAEIGIVSGSKIDFTNVPELSVKALIYLTAAANATHTIFSTDNVRLLIVNNQLTAAVRQPGGMYGVISERTLQQNTLYRVGLHFKNQELVLSIDDRYDSRVNLSYPIAPPITSNYRATIGGNILGEYFPGYIDDVRMENIAGIDLELPTITMVEPQSFQVNTNKPNFRILLADDGSGIDVNSVFIYLNGIQQSSLSISANEINGQMNDALNTGVINEVRVEASDMSGNTSTKRFYLTLQEIGSKGEYLADSNTLALWHMNDFSSGRMLDSSLGQHHGVGESKFVTIGEGVFSKAKYFNGNSTSLLNFDGVRFDQKFTYEGWFKPVSNYSSDEILFYNGQITVARYNGGFIRVVFHTTNGTVVFASPTALLPSGELHHLAVTWDGTKKEDNLYFFVDGILYNMDTAVSSCDFDPIPKVGVLGQYFSGMIDEVRVSSVTRNGFNIPTLDNQGISFLTLKDGTSVLEDYPEFLAALNSPSTINVNSVIVRLNGISQTGSELLISESGISGKFDNQVKAGLNTVEVEFFDNAGNFKKKSQYFFGIKPNGAAEYNSNELTAGLWHFNENMIDSSSENAHVTSGTYKPVPGWMGSSQSYAVAMSNNINLNCRSFTIEGFFKFDKTQTLGGDLIRLNSSTFTSRLNLQSSNGNLNLNINSNLGSIDTSSNAAFPLDTAYHHLALVYDGSRDFSQLLLLVDGQVKLAKDFKMTCDQGSQYTLNLGEVDTFHFDEVRISREAVYEYNLQKAGTDKPEITQLSHVPNSTVSGPDLNFSFVVEDAEGVDTTKTKLYLNDVEIMLGSSSSKAKFATNFSATLPLLPGTNKVKISVLDLNGNQVINSFKLYSFAKLPSGPYEVDANTKFLFHFEEPTGPFTDASGNTGSQSDSGWVRILEGVFGAAASTYYSNPIQVTGLDTLEGFTFETWMKLPVLNAQLTIVQRDSGQFFGIVGSNQLSVRFEKTGFTFMANIPAIYQDLNFHHYAVIVDPLSLTDNVYLLVDGQVIGSTKHDPAELKFNSSSNFYLGYPLFNGVLDEARFSTVARYELISTRE